MRNAGLNTARKPSLTIVGFGSVDLPDADDCWGIGPHVARFGLDAARPASGADGETLQALARELAMLKKKPAGV
jgi:hypothetical protein